MNAIKAGLKSSWKYAAWTVAGAVVITLVDPLFLEELGTPQILAAVIALIGKGLITTITLMIKENKP